MSANETELLDEVSRTEILKDVRSQRVKGPGTRPKSTHLSESTVANLVDINDNDAEEDTEPEVKSFLPSMLRKQGASIFEAQLANAFKKNLQGKPLQIRPHTVGDIDDLGLGKLPISSDETTAIHTNSETASVPISEAAQTNGQTLSTRVFGTSPNMDNDSMGNLRPTFIMKEIKELKAQEQNMHVPIVEIKERKTMMEDIAISSQDQAKSYRRNNEATVSSMKKNLLAVAQSVKALEASLKSLKRELAIIFNEVKELEDNND